jgi:hypothetical protein
MDSFLGILLPRFQFRFQNKLGSYSSTIIQIIHNIIEKAAVCDILPLLRHFGKGDKRRAKTIIAPCCGQINGENKFKRAQGAGARAKAQTPP